MPRVKLDLHDLHQHSTLAVNIEGQEVLPGGRVFFIQFLLDDRLEFISSELEP